MNYVIVNTNDVANLLVQVDGIISRKFSFDFDRVSNPADYEIFPTDYFMRPADYHFRKISPEIMTITNRLFPESYFLICR